MDVELNGIELHDHRPILQYKIVYTLQGSDPSNFPML